MTLAETWRPGRYYTAGTRVRWNGYLLVCRRDHTCPEDARDPWVAPLASRGQHLKDALAKWHVCAEEMLDEYWERVRAMGGPDRPKK